MENLCPSDWFILGVEEATENSHLVKLKFPPTHRFSSSLDRERDGRKNMKGRDNLSPSSSGLAIGQADAGG